MGALAQKVQYARDLWWFMHHSYSPRRRTVAVGCYVDDSGTHEESPTAVVGGPVFLRPSFGDFTLDWEKDLLRHHVTPPIHMKEFTNPKGRFVNLSAEKRLALFQDLVRTINKYKLYSITTCVVNQNFREFFPARRFKGLFGPAPLAFLWMVLLNSHIVLSHDRMEKMAYLVSHSARADSQMSEVHAFWQKFEEFLPKQGTGALAYDTPTNINALQAADMIAWSNRKKQMGETFGSGFDPLERLTRTIKGGQRNYPHFHFVVSKKSTKGLAEIINEADPDPRKIGHLEMVKIFKDAFEKAQWKVWNKRGPKK